VVVGPLRLARGVQNKVLEAMAMGQPVVAAASCVQAIDAQPGLCVAAAEHAQDYIREVNTLLSSAQASAAMGTQARAFVMQHFDWTARMSGIDRALAQVLGQQGAAA
jgi:glycosyltransferase involved in cell wall biosynthesis